MPEIPLLLWSANQTGEALGITEDAAKNLHRVGKLKGHLVGRSLRFRPCDVERYVAKLGGDS